MLTHALQQFASLACHLQVETENLLKHYSLRVVPFLEALGKVVPSLVHLKEAAQRNVAAASEMLHSNGLYSDTGSLLMELPMRF